MVVSFSKSGVAFSTAHSNNWSMYFSISSDSGGLAKTDNMNFVVLSLMTILRQIIKSLIYFIFMLVISDNSISSAALYAASLNNDPIAAMTLSSTSPAIALYPTSNPAAVEINEARKLPFSFNSLSIISSRETMMSYPLILIINTNKNNKIFNYIFYDFKFIKKVDITFLSSIFKVRTLGLATGVLNPFFIGGAFGLVGEPGFKIKVLKGVPFINGW